MGEGRQRHPCAAMVVLPRLRSIHAQAPDDVDRQLLEVRLRRRVAHTRTLPTSLVSLTRLRLARLDVRLVAGASLAAPQEPAAASASEPDGLAANAVSASI